jgi:hypothetical protein
VRSEERAEQIPERGTSEAITVGLSKAARQASMQQPLLRDNRFLKTQRERMVRRGTAEGKRCRATPQ